MGVIPKFEDAVTVTWEHDDFKGVTELRVNFSASMLYHVKDGCTPSEYERAKDITVEKLREQVADSAASECHFVKYNDNFMRCDRCGFTSIPAEHGGWWFYCPSCGLKVASS